MKKFLGVVIVGVLFLGAAGYFGMQWRIQKTTDDFFSNLFFVDASYQDVGIDLNGDISLSSLELFIPSSQLSISVATISLSTGSLWNTLTLQREIENGKLPDQLNLNVDSFSMALDPNMISSLDAMYAPDLYSELLGMGCGRNTYIGPQEYYDMGVQFLSFDLDLGYKYAPDMDQLVGTTDLYMDGIANVRIDQTFMGLGSIMQDYRSAAFNFDPNALSPVNISVEYADLGFNAMLSTFCAEEAGMTRREWQDLNVSMFAALLEQIGFESDLDALKLYSDLNQPRVRFTLSLQPLPGISMADLEFYDMSELLNVLDLLLIVNNEQVAFNTVSFNDGGLSSVDLDEIRSAFQVGVEEAPVAKVNTESNEPSSPRRIMQDVAISSLEQHLYRNVLIERKDGKTFTGELLEVNGNRVVVRTRFTSGYTDLPLQRNEFAEVKLYPED